MLIVPFKCPHCGVKLETLIEATVTCRCGKQMESKAKEAKKKRKKENKRLRKLIRKVRRHK